MNVSHCKTRYRRSTLSIAAILAGGPVWAEVVFDGTLGPMGTLSGNFTITDAYGTQVGPNLFHSFETFNVNTGESATFTSSFAGVTDNVIARVTGGNLTTIDGLVASMIPGADLWIVNPTGVVIGENASLDVLGSFVGTTADHLLLEDGGRFDATDPASSMLTMANPVEFGFVDGTIASLTAGAATLEVGPGESISLVGGDIALTGSSLLAPAGTVNLASVAGAGGLRLDSSGLVPNGTSAFGNLALSGATVETSGASGGDIYIRAGQFVVDSQSYIHANTTGADASDRGGDIVADADDVAVLHGSQITSTTEGAGDGGDLIFRVADDLTIQGADAAATPAGVFANVATGATGDAGSILLSAENVNLIEGAAVTSETLGSGNAGNITLSVGDTLLMQSTPDSFNSDLLVNSSSGTGDSGTLQIDAAHIVMEMGGLIQVQNADGNAGLLSVDADSISLSGASQMSTSTSGTGPGSLMELNAGSIVLDGYQVTSFGTFTSGLFASSGSSASGAGGTIMINADSLTVSDYAEITATTFGSGTGGNVIVDVGEASFDGGNIFVNTAAFSLGDGGRIDFRSDTLSITGGGIISAGTYSGGDAGDVMIDVSDRVYIEGEPNTFTGVFTNSYWTGNAGSISITTPELEVQQGGFIQSGAFPFANNQYETGPLQTGNGGNIELSVDTLLVDAAFVSARTETSGNSGTITVNAAESVTLRNSTGLITGASPIGGLLVSAGSLINLPDAMGGAGNVIVNTPELIITDGGVITADTFLLGNGGNIEINAGVVDISGQDSIYTGLFNSTVSIGNAGLTTINADEFRLSGLASVRGQSFSDGLGGSIVIDSDVLSITDGGTVTSAAAAGGAGGNVVLEGRAIDLSNGGIASASAAGTGNAGTVTIFASDSLTVADGGAIETSSDVSAGGNIDLEIANLLRMDGGLVSAAAGGVTPSDDGGNVSVDPDFVVLRDSDILANANAGNGGNISIRAGAFVIDTDSVIDASSNTGLDGEILIDSPNEVTDGVLPLEAPSTNPGGLLTQRCLPQLASQRSTLVASVNARGIDTPGDYLSSPPAEPDESLASRDALAASPTMVDAVVAESCFNPI